MENFRNHIAEILGLITGCGLWMVWLTYLWRHTRRHYSEHVSPEGVRLLSQPLHSEALQHSNNAKVWIIMTWKDEDWLRRVVLNTAFKLFGQKIAWAAHWVLVVERENWYSYFELQRQRRSEEPVRCIWSILQRTDDDESPDFPLATLTELPSRYDSERLLNAIPKSHKMSVGTTTWSDTQIFNAGNEHFRQNFPITHDYGVMNNNCQTFVYMLAKSLCPQSPLLLTQLPGVAPTALRLLDLPPAVCFISSTMVVGGIIAFVLTALSRIVGVKSEEKQEPFPLYLTYFLILLYALASILDRRRDTFMSSYHPSRTVALDSTAWAYSSSFGQNQNFIPRKMMNRGFFWNKYEIILIVGALILSIVYTGTSDISYQRQIYYYLISFINVLVLSFSFIGPYTLFGDFIVIFGLIVPLAHLISSFIALLETKDLLDLVDIAVYFVRIFVLFPLLCIGETTLVLDIFKYRIFNI